MLRRDANKFVSICDGFRKRNFFHLGRGFLPLLAVMLLATPQLAFANGLTISVKPDSLDLNETGTGARGTYEVVLEAEPEEEVVVTVVGAVVNGENVLTVSPLTLTFTPDGGSTPWDEFQEVTVEAVLDDDAAPERVTLTHTATVGGDEVTLRRAATVTVRVADTAPGKAVIVTAATPFTVGEADAAGATYTVHLMSEPTGTVAVDVVGVSEEISVSPSRLIFMPEEDYSDSTNLPTRTVTVFAGEDFDADDETVTLTHKVSGGDYTDQTAEPVEVTVDDNDTRGIDVAPTSLNVAAGTRGTFMIKLDTQPKGTVDVSVEKNLTADNDQVTVIPGSVRFSARDWNRPKQVTVVAGSKAATQEQDRDRSLSVTVDLSVDESLSNRDDNYNAAQLSSATVEVTISAALPAVGITLSRSSMTVEEGSDEEYTVSLSRNPATEMSVFVTSSDLSSVTIDPTSALVFTADVDGSGGTWRTPQDVTVTAIRDPDAVRESVVLEHRWTPGGPIVKTSTVTVGELNTRGVTVSTKELEVSEGESNTYTLTLESEPAGGDPVTVTVTASSTDVTVEPAQLRFTSRGDLETVTVTSIGDDDAEPNPSVTLSHTVRGADYGNVAVDRVKVTIPEEDNLGIEIINEMFPTEEGTSGTYQVRLTSQPTRAVTVQVRSDSDDVTVKPSQLKFTTSDWNKGQTVNVEAGHDDDAQDDPFVTLTHTASGGGYDGVSKKVRLTIEDDDEIRIGARTSPRALTITEGGATKRYTVVLLAQPTGPVRVQVGVDPPASASRIRIEPPELAFTQGNWNAPQGVRIWAPEDNIDLENSDLELTHTMSGGGYGAITASVSVRFRDNDERGVTLTPTALEVVQESWQEYTVELDSEPTGAVNIAVGAPAGVTASPTTLNFKTSNWSSPKRVRVSVSRETQNDQDRTGLELTHTITGVDVGYNLLAPTLDLTVRTNKEAGVAVSPPELEITEGDSESYTVVLTKKPEANVTIQISGADGDVSSSPRTLTFSINNWSKQKTVTVRLSEDEDASDDQVVTLVHTVSSTDVDYDGVSASPVTVTPKDNDKRGVTVTPTSLTIPAGASGTYRVKLTTQPTDAVTVNVNDPLTDDVTVSGPPLVFTTSNWRTQQTVTVTVDEDAGADEEQTVTLTHRVSGGDYPGDGDVPFVTVTIPVEGVPSAPRGLSATVGDGRVTLSWSAPSSDGGSAIVRYEYRYRESDGSYGGWTTVSGGASATSHTVRGLENGKNYEFQVRARNSIGAGQSATAGATLAESVPEAPAGLTATGGDESVTLSWAAPATGGSQILRYEFRYAALNQTYSDWMEVDGGGGATGITISGLTNGTEYGFQVQAVNTIGEGAASTVNATPGTAPSVPVGLAARVGDQMVTLMWGMPADDGGSAILRYELCYRESGAAGSCSDWREVGGGAEASSTTIMDLTNGRVYEFQVRAVNGLPGGRGNGEAAMVEAAPMAGLDFAHFINGTSNGVSGVSDLVLVNVDTSTVSSAIYFYDRMGGLVDPASLVDVMGDLEDTGDGGVVMDIEGLGETTVSTNGEGALVTGSVKVFSTGRVGGVLRFDIRGVGVAGVGASQPVSEAIFPARRQADGINTGAAIRNLEAEPTTVTCHLMQGGEVLETKSGELEADGQRSWFIHQLFTGVDTSDFEGSVHCTAPEGGMFTGVALEMDVDNQIFTTLPLVPVDPETADAGMSTLNFAHFGNGDIGGTAMSSDLVFVNVANTPVAPAIYFYAQDGSMIAADTLVDAMMEGLEVAEDGALMVMDEIAPMGEMTISTNGLGSGMVGSVKVVSDGPIGGVIRFDIPGVGVAGVGASQALNAAVFPARRVADGINTGAAIRNLEAERMMVTCRLMQGGEMVPDGVKDIDLDANGQSSMFINQIFEGADTDAFEGSVHCSAPQGGMFTGVALEMDVDNQIFTTLPLVPVQ